MDPVLEFRSCVGPTQHPGWRAAAHYLPCLAACLIPWFAYAHWPDDARVFAFGFHYLACGVLWIHCWREAQSDALECLERPPLIVIRPQVLQYRGLYERPYCVIERDEVKGLEWPGYDNVGVRLRSGRVVSVPVMCMEDRAATLQAVEGWVRSAAAAGPHP